jgi:hypothetical protein
MVQLLSAYLHWQSFSGKNTYDFAALCTLLTLVTLGAAKQIEMSLIVSHHPRQNLKSF